MGLYAQQDSFSPPQTFVELTSFEKEQLKDLPVLQLPENYLHRSLPAIVDNSTQSCMRPAFNQDGYSCGQASGIAYNFTYEVNRKRNLPSNIPDNQYPTHFAWNWLNSGYGYFGVSYLHSFKILKKYGMPNVVDYGGSMSYGGNQRWMSGYDEYYNGMHNRINGAKQIQVGTPEGLEVLKHWLHDHLEGSDIGGIASFYAQYMAPQAQLPAGTPEAGKWVITYFGGNANHAMTIVGYNDSIRYDYNSDGYYTNNVDINNDGVVDMKDWEIGGFKMVNSYGGVPGWGDEGYAYMMYKTVADDLGSGGIWNHCVHILDAKETCEPQLTMKVTLKHDSRNKIKVVAGLSTDTSQLLPQTILEFPILNYQGGNLYMQGGTSPEENKILNFGLDITSLLTHIESGDTSKFFLQVIENDSAGAGTGEVISYSLMDYTSGSNEIPCNQSHVPIVEDGITTMDITTAITFDKVEILNSNLPPGPIGQPYSLQMMASGGTPPYRWFLDKTYEEEYSSATYPAIMNLKLNPSNNNSGFVTHPINFDFPFYDSVYSEVTVHVDGYLMFDEQLYPYPYFNDDLVLFSITRNISPFMSEDMKIIPYQGDGLWYEGDSTHATFRWKCHFETITSDAVDVAVTLYPDGTITFHYGTISVGDDLYWIPGISDGNDEHYQLAGIYNAGIPATDAQVTFTRYNYPPELSLSENGLLTGTIMATYPGMDMKFRVEDNNFISNYKTLTFSSSGIVILDSISAGGDNLVDYGDTVKISVDILNIENNPVMDASMVIRTEDPFIVITDSTEYLGKLPVGTMKSYPDAFEFITDPNIPDNHGIQLQTIITGSRQTWENSLLYEAHSPVLLVEEIIIDDGNGRLDPGDSASMLIGFKNQGSATAENIFSELTNPDPNITIEKSMDTIISLPGDSIFYGHFRVIVSEDVPIGHTSQFETIFSNNFGYTAVDSFNLKIGLNVEDFESGDFTTFSWGFGHDRDWEIENVFFQEGAFSARSGRIHHDQQSSLILDVNVLEDGEISFYKRVSCEDDENNDNWDYLAFLIDDNEIARWDGEVDWSQETFPVEAGNHRLEWLYHKDSSVSRGYDAAWIDYITLPSCTDVVHQLEYNPEAIHKLMLPENEDTDTMIMANNSWGSNGFEVMVSYNQDTAVSRGSRNIYGSALMADVIAAYTGQQVTLNLTVYNTSDDDEWLREIVLSVPPQAGVVTASNFTGGSEGDMIYDGSMGYGCTVSWFGENASGWGVVKGGEVATATLTLTTMPEMTDKIEIPYTVYGDIYGNEPHEHPGTLEIMNLGQNHGWLSISDSSGTIPGNDELTEFITINTGGMADGDYFARLIIHEQFQVKKEIPVYLTVDHALGEKEPDFETQLSIYPNPFSSSLRIEWNQASEGVTSLEIWDVTGKKIASIHDGHKLNPGKHVVYWNGVDETGKQCHNGVYFIILENDELRITRKVLLIN